jgi:hypothetical protein
MDYLKEHYRASGYRKEFPINLRPFFENEWVVIKTAGDGNCGPDSVSKALDQSPGRTALTIAEVRGIVARSITRDNIDTWHNKLARYNVDTPDTATIHQIAENAITPEDLSVAVTLSGYYLDNDDLATVGAHLGVYIMFVNQYYNPERAQKQHKNITDDIAHGKKPREYVFNAELLSTLIMCQPHIGPEHDFLRSILDGDDPDVMLLYNRSDVQHYELLMRLEAPRTIMPYSSLPSAIRGFIQRVCLRGLDQAVPGMTEAEQLAAVMKLSLQEVGGAKQEQKAERKEEAEQERDDAIDELLIKEERLGDADLAIKDREWREQQDEAAQLQRDLAAIAEAEQKQSVKKSAPRVRKRWKPKSHCTPEELAVKKEEQRARQEEREKLKRRHSQLKKSRAAEARKMDLDRPAGDQARKMHREILQEEEEEEEVKENGVREDESQEWTEDESDKAKVFDCLSFDADLPVTWMLRCANGSGRWIQLPHRIFNHHRSECYNFAHYVRKRTRAPATNMHVVHDMDQGHVYIYADDDGNCELRSKSWHFLSPEERAHLGQFLPPTLTQNIQTDWPNGPATITIAQV